MNGFKNDDRDLYPGAAEIRTRGYSDSLASSITLSMSCSLYSEKIIISLAKAEHSLKNNRAKGSRLAQSVVPSTVIGICSPSPECLVTVLIGTGLGDKVTKVSRDTNTQIPFITQTKLCLV